MGSFKILMICCRSVFSNLFLPVVSPFYNRQITCNHFYICIKRAMPGTSPLTVVSSAHSKSHLVVSCEALSSRCHLLLLQPPFLLGVLLLRWRGESVLRALTTTADCFLLCLHSKITAMILQKTLWPLTTLRLGTHCWACHRCKLGSKYSC